MSQNTSSKKPPDNLRELLRVAARPTIFILFLIMVCAFLAHYLTGSETLEEYARNHPETAYGSADESADRSPDATAPASRSNPESMDAPAETSKTPSAYNIPKDAVAGDGTAERENSDSTGTRVSGMQNADAETSSAKSSKTSGTEDSSIKGTDIGTEDSKAKDPKTSGTADMESDHMTGNEARTTYQTGFYYEPLDDSIIQRITGISYPETGCTVPYEDLNYVGLLYIDFDGEEQAGELICNKAIAQDMVEIFYELYQNDYRIEKIRLIDEYGGDDTRSMLDNNTSCFNYRVVDGTNHLSKHALGCAIDINPFYNPYVVFNRGANGETYISPKGSEIYADRSRDFPYKIDENDLCYRLFKEHGFTWGGNWNSCKDYQHFQIVL